MDNSNKRKCMCHEGTDNSIKRICLRKEESGRISDLPNEMIGHILSFLPTKEAVQMSVLSQRWVNLWDFSPCLNFSPYEFGVVDGYERNIMKKKELGAKFKQFVETVLHRREASFLDSFMVKFPQIQDEGRCSELVQTCVSYAIKHKGKVFSMEAYIPSEELCTSLFTCESMEEMRLLTSVLHKAPNTVEVIPEVVNLPRVRRLHLKKSRIDKRSISKLLSGCPILEELILENCFIESLCIFSQNLKYLCLHRSMLKLTHIQETLIINSILNGNTVESTISTASSQVEFARKATGASSVDSPSPFMQKTSSVILV